MITNNIVGQLKKLGTVIISSYLFIISPVHAGDITGSVHDFSDGTYKGGSTYTWNTSGELCVVCHTPHASDTSVTVAPLWNHSPSTSTTYNLYTSNTLTATVGQPTGVSVLCLSCHDGSVAVDSFGGATGTNMIDTINAAANIGEDSAGTGNLKNDHPISFTYDAALATADGGLFDPSKTVTTGGGTRTRTGTITATMLSGGTVQCTTCHDVHNNYVNTTDTDPKLLRIARSGSDLCLACHDK
ncbi:MAG: cytochrome c3 family protein [Gammaproteobacteria bacterium]|nr:cytochrome c3 family protein [Gammaproteobacteria bacterium]